MIFTTTVVATLVLGLVSKVAADPIVDTPSSLEQCMPAQVSWKGATPPVFLSLIETSQVGHNSDPLYRFPPQNASSGALSWQPVNIKAGTTITLLIRDSTGMTNAAAPVTIGSGSGGCGDVKLLGSGVASTPGSATGGTSTNGTSGGTGGSGGTSTSTNSSSTTPTGSSPTGHSGQSASANPGMAMVAAAVLGATLLGYAAQALTVW
ncbi:unnamed protein product [Parajaminaea phylloscopi]